MQTVLMDYYHESLIDLAMDNDELVNKANTRVYESFTELTGVTITEQDHELWDQKSLGNMFDYTPDELAKHIKDNRPKQKMLQMSLVLIDNILYIHNSGFDFSNTDDIRSFAEAVDPSGDRIQFVHVYYGTGLVGSVQI